LYLFSKGILLRYFLELAYKGTAYHGWQLQANAHSVQAELNAAMQTVLRQTVETIGSGRTDTGVHALQQFVHFDLPAPISDTSQFLMRVNAVLPTDIVVKEVFLVQPDAHARYDADFRRYEYRISRSKNPFLQETCSFYSKPLRLDLMNQASQLLLRYEDFECFSRVKTEVNHFRCRIDEAYWQQGLDWARAELLVFHIRADRFLRGMVRTIVGTLLWVGQERITLEEFEEIILSKDRKRAGQAVPAQGLFLTEVHYPDTLRILMEK
jgi:tRNA pseudouridine38-40 synthase